MMFRVSLLWLSLVTPASALSSVPACVGIVGCDTSGNQLVNAISPVAELIVAFAAAFATLFVIVGGFMMLMSSGNEGNAEKGKTYIIYSLIGFALTLMSQTIVHFVMNNAGAVSSMGATNAPFNLIGQAVRMMLSLFNVVFIAVALIAGFRMVIGGGQSSQFETAKKSLMWAVAGAIVVNISYALINATINLGF